MAHVVGLELLRSAVVTNKQETVSQSSLSCVIGDKNNYDPDGHRMVMFVLRNYLAY